MKVGNRTGGTAIPYRRTSVGQDSAAYSTSGIGQCGTRYGSTFQIFSTSVGRTSAVPFQGCRTVPYRIEYGTGWVSGTEYGTGAGSPNFND